MNTLRLLIWINTLMIGKLKQEWWPKRTSNCSQMGKESDLFLSFVILMGRWSKLWCSMRQSVNFIKTSKWEIFIFGLMAKFTLCQMESIAHWRIHIKFNSGSKVESTKLRMIFPSLNNLTTSVQFTKHSSWALESLYKW